MLRWGQRLTVIGFFVSIPVAMTLFWGVSLRAEPSIGEEESFAWGEAEDSGASELYQSYLDRYPMGFCSNLARVRLTEAELWEQIQESFNPQTVMEFVRKHPNSPFSRTAIDHLDLILSKSSPSLTHTGEASQLKRELGEVENCDIQLQIQAEKQRLVEVERLVEEQRRAEDVRREEEARVAAERRAAEERRAEERRLVEEQRRAKEVRREEEARVAAERRAAEERRAEERRLVEEQRRAEEVRREEEARVAAERRAAEERQAEERRLAEGQRKEKERKAVVAEASVLIPVIEAFANTGPTNIDLLRLVELFHKARLILEGQWSEELRESYLTLSALVTNNTNFIIFKEEDEARRAAARKAQALSLQRKVAEAISLLEQVIIEEFSSPVAPRVVPIVRSLKEALFSDNPEILEGELNRFRNFVEVEGINTMFQSFVEAEGQSDIGGGDSEEGVVPEHEVTGSAEKSLIEKLMEGSGLTRNEIIALLDTQKWSFSSGISCLISDETYQVFSTRGRYVSMDGKVVKPERVETVQFSVDETNQSFVMEQHTYAVDFIGDAPSAKVTFAGKLNSDGSLFVQTDIEIVDFSSTAGNVKYDRSPTSEGNYEACLLTE